MFNRLLPLLLLLLVAVVLATDEKAGPDAAEPKKKQDKRDPRVYDSRPSGAKHRDDDDDDDDDNELDDDDDDDDLKGKGKRGGGGGEGGKKRRKKGDDHEHDPTFDHESFLGHEESSRFGELSPKQAKNALLEMLPKIDANADGNVTVDEMQAYLAAVAKREGRLSTDRRFEEIKLFNHALDLNAPMTLEEYRKALQHASGGSNENDTKSTEEFNNQFVRDQARWAKADLDGDKSLSREEFYFFMRPEEAPHMRDIVIQEAMISADKNKDGKIDLTEFMTELHPTYEADVKDKKKLPEWVEKEEKRFKEKLDANKDNALDPNEIYNWIVPEDYDHSRKETAHLFKIADKDNDKNLTREEILNKWESFVGHKAETAPHDEL